MTSDEFNALQQEVVDEMIDAMGNEATDETDEDGGRDQYVDAEIYRADDRLEVADVTAWFRDCMARGDRELRVVVSRCGEQYFTGIDLSPMYELFEKSAVEFCQLMNARIDSEIENAPKAS